MRLLDFADVKRGDSDWMLGFEADDRGCGLRANLLDDLCEDPPDETAHNLVGGVGTVRSKPYRVGVFGVTARFSRSLFCSKNDDEEWLRGKMKDLEEYAVGRAITVDHSVNGETWIGGTNALAESLGSDTEPSDAVERARDKWFLNNVGEPALHLAANTVRNLVTEGILLTNAKDGDVVTVWGDKVVQSPGYLPGTIFWSGEIEVHLSTSQVATLIAARQNDAVVRGDQYGSIDFAPCSVVRVGATPTPRKVEAEATLKVAPHNTTSTIEPMEYKVGTPEPYETVPTVMNEPVDIPQPTAVAVLDKPEPKAKTKAKAKVEPEPEPEVEKKHKGLLDKVLHHEDGPTPTAPSKPKPPRTGE